MVSRSSFSRNSRSSSVALAIVPLCDGLSGDALQHRMQNGFGSLSVRMGIEVQDDAMAQHPARYVQDVLYGEVEAPAHQRVHTAALHQRLRAARRTAVADVPLGQ